MSVAWFLCECMWLLCVRVCLCVSVHSCLCASPEVVNIVCEDGRVRRKHGRVSERQTEVEVERERVDGAVSKSGCGWKFGGAEHSSSPWKFNDLRP